MAMSKIPPATEETAQIIRRNWEQVCEQVTTSCLRVGRDPAEVRVVGVSKYVDARLCLQLVQAGCRVLGENRPQSLWEKFAWFAEHAEHPVEWHMIGHLQRNKVRRTLSCISCLHSLDSLRLAEEVSREAVAVGIELSVLLEVNVTRDSSKTGLLAADMPEFMERVVQLPGLVIGGLMAMASLDGDAANAQREFAEVRKLRDRLAERFPSLDLSHLSMGMSGDFEAAIAEGSTLVRIGSSLWRGVLSDA